MRKALTCPICNKMKVKRLSTHLEMVHKISGSDKTDLLRKAREVYVYTSPISFMEFFLSLKKIPLTYREYKLLNCCNNSVEAAWVSKSVRDLPPKLINMLRSAYERLMLTQGH